MSAASRQKILRVGLLALWALAAAGGLYAWWRSGIPVTGLPDALRTLVAGAGAWGPALYCGAFILRALTLAPASPFVLAAGLIWGPWLGMFWALVGINLSAWAAYGVARVLGREWVAQHETPWMKKAEERLKAAPFFSSMILRLIFIPFDPVNYACGLAGIPFLPYAAGTALGVLPGGMTFAFFGGAWSDPRALAISIGVLVLSLVLAKTLKARHQPG
ncbi:MAG: TVP38/TMEM64 family protein [Elusimicrobia bacterium]|nr:TVP38/TMEM64 family protein [Elusimicrobiota bacterium]